MSLNWETFLIAASRLPAIVPLLQRPLQMTLAGERMRLACPSRRLAPKRGKVEPRPPASSVKSSPIAGNQMKISRFALAPALRASVGRLVRLFKTWSACFLG